MRKYKHRWAPRLESIKDTLLRLGKNPWAYGDFIAMQRTMSPLTPVFILALLLSLTIMAWRVSQRSLNLQREVQFDAMVQRLDRDLRYRMQTYGNTLMQTRSLFHQVPRLDRRTFREYVSDLHILDVYPGLLGIGYAERIPGHQLRRHEEAVRRTGLRNYKVWPQGERTKYISIVYMEPANSMNSRAFGFDMSTDPTRQEAMDRARDTGRPAASGVVRLVKESPSNERDLGFVLYVPLYISGRVPASLDERRRQLLGFIYSPFKAHDLFEVTFRPKVDSLPLAVRISSASPHEAPEELYRYGEPAQGSGALRRTLPIDIAGQSWLLEATTTDQFPSMIQEHVPKLILMAGIALSVLTFWFLQSSQFLVGAEQARARQLETLIRTSRVISGELEIGPLAQAVTDAGRELSGAEFGAFFYSVPGEKLGEGIGEEASSYPLYALSGARRSDFEKFPVIRSTPVFAPTFEGRAVVRSDDITKDARYGSNPPFQGMSKGHLPVRSYLGVPVKTRSGQLIGALLYGHPDAAVFGEREEKLVTGLAAQAAVAMDNARLYQNAQEAVRVRDEFLSIASHELKTPLTPLKLHLQGLLRRWDREGDVDPQMRKMAQNADRQITRLSRLVDDLLDVSRISAGLLKLNREEVDFVEILRESAERFQPQLADVGNTLTLEHPVSLVGRFDRLRLEQVVANLFSNAIRYAPGTPLKASLSLRGESLHFSFEDQGPGVSADKREVVFERFERVAPNAGALGGLGLGLFITRQIIDAHGGSIHLAEGALAGARFEIELPLEAESMAEAPAGNSPRT